RYANRSFCFISAYHHGLTGTEATWAAKKYRGHQCLPPGIVAEVKKSIGHA
ncbi:hypothetical protein C8J56DRAFT_797712, partial [Mycena floridula]